MGKKVNVEMIGKKVNVETIGYQANTIGYKVKTMTWDESKTRTNLGQILPRPLQLLLQPLQHPRLLLRLLQRCLYISQAHPIQVRVRVGTGWGGEGDDVVGCEAGVEFAGGYLRRALGLG